MGSYIPPTVLPENQLPDDLLMVNPTEDAFIAVQTVQGKPDEEPAKEDAEKLKKVLERFYKSELVNLLGRLQGNHLGAKGQSSRRIRRQQVQPADHP